MAAAESLELHSIFRKFCFLGPTVSQCVVMAQSQSVSLSPLELLERAEAFRTYQKTPKAAKPRYFLLCHSIELALKAYISSHRPSSEEELIAKFGHDLTKLLDEAIKLGLKVSASTESEVHKLTEAHKAYLAGHSKEAAHRMLVAEYFVERHMEKLFKAVRQKMVGSKPRR